MSYFLINIEGYIISDLVISFAIGPYLGDKITARATHFCQQPAASIKTF